MKQNAIKLVSISIKQIVSAIITIFLQTTSSSSNEIIIYCKLIAIKVLSFYYKICIIIILRASTSTKEQKELKSKSMLNAYIIIKRYKEENAISKDHVIFF